MSHPSQEWKDKMRGYYQARLSSQRLKRCYEIAPPRVQQYLEAEIAYVLQKIRPGNRVLELGCGYGRVLQRLVAKAGFVFGIDNSCDSLILACEELSEVSNCFLAAMNAVQLGFQDESFDLTVCIQNGISAFHVDPRDLIRESLRVTKQGGTVLFSSYSDSFWNDRLEWFQRQADAGLVGEIDYEKTGHGVIVCKDGFTATTLRRPQFFSYTSGLGVRTKFVEVDKSSLFCEIARV